MDFGPMPADSAHFQDFMFSKSRNALTKAFRKWVGTEEKPECPRCVPRGWGWGTDYRTRYFSCRRVISEVSLLSLEGGAKSPKATQKKGNTQIF